MKKNSHLSKRFLIALGAMGLGSSLLAQEDSKEVAEAPVVAEAVDYLAIAKVLEKLRTNGNYKMKNMTPEYLEKTRSLVISNSKATNEDLMQLSQLPNVIFWTMGRCKNLDAGCIPALKRMTNARVIDLVDNKNIFKDVDSFIEAFKDHKHLRMLAIGGMEEIEQTDKYKAFLESRPDLKVLSKPYKQQRIEQGTMMNDIKREMIEDGVVSTDEVRFKRIK